MSEVSSPKGLCSCLSPLPFLANKRATPFRSPQLTLWTINADEWLFYWKTPDRAPAHRKRRVEGLVQPFLFDFLLEEKAVGNEGNGARRSRTHLHLVGKRAQSQETEE